MKFKVTFPYCSDMGSISPMVVRSSPMETAKEQALWQLNSMRQHDGLRPLRALPAGCVFTKVPEAS
jgi:hypothetical protein